MRVLQPFFITKKIYIYFHENVFALREKKNFVFSFVFVGGGGVLVGVPLAMFSFGKISAWTRSMDPQKDYRETWSSQGHDFLHQAYASPGL